MFFSAVAHGGETPVSLFVIRLAAFSLAGVALWRSRKEYPLWLPVDISVTVFLFYVTLSTTWAVYPWSALQYAMNVLAAASVYVLLRVQWMEGDTGKHAERLLLVMVVAGIVQSAWASYQYLYGQPGRASGSFANPNHLAGFLLFGVAAAVHFLKREVDRRNAAGIFVFGAFAFLMACSVVLTKSRAMIPVIAGAFLFLLLALRGRNAYRFLAGATASAAILAAVAAPRFSALVDPYAYSRWKIWKAAVRTALDHPLGAGLGGFKFFWLHYRDPIEGAVFRYWKTADTAHSQFFGFLSELGFPGVFLAATAAVSVLALVLRESRREDRILPLSLIPLAAMIHAFFDVNLDIPGITLPVAACTALLANRNMGSPRRGISVSPVIKSGISLILLPCLAYSVATFAGHRRYADGVEFLRKGDTERAMEGFSEASRIDPLNSGYPDAVASVHYRRFLASRHPQHLAASVDAERRAISASPWNPYHLSQAGFLMGELSKTFPDGESRRRLLSLSISTLEESLQRNPNDIVAQMRMADVLRISGMEMGARDILEKLIAVEPNAVRAYVMLADVEASAYPGKAAELYRKAIALSMELEGKSLEPSLREFVELDRDAIRQRVEILESDISGRISRENDKIRTR
ncbi:MAG: O-antigen ligase family protein [Deltaproteobacteria bacterium]|nr:O-antigen ligase family protein [Deltaproteobacteria bacterium]